MGLVRDAHLIQFVNGQPTEDGWVVEERGGFKKRTTMSAEESEKDRHRRGRDAYGVKKKSRWRRIIEGAGKNPDGTDKVDVEESEPGDIVDEKA